MAPLRGRYAFNRPTAAAAGCCLMLMAMAGCGGSARVPKPVPAAGQVLFEGRPLPRAHVTLVPAANAPADLPRPTAFTDGQGRFELSTFTQRDGAPEGEYVVLVSYTPLVGRGDDLQAGPNLLPPRFSDPVKSPIRAKVTKGQPELEPIQVTRR